MLSPALARPIAAAGWTKANVRRHRWRETRKRAGTAERALRADGAAFSFREWVESGRLPAEYAESDDPDRLVPVILDPSDVLIAVAGNPNRNHAIGYLQHGGYGTPLSRAVESGGT